MVDYKNNRRRKKKKDPTPGWVWLLFGLAVGLSVALVIYIADRRPTVHQAAASSKPVPSSIREDDGSEEPEEESGNSFDFYTMLPNFEVVIPESDIPDEVAFSSEPVEEPRKYVLQAGSFTSYADADRRKASLALLGIESRIERVAIDDNTFHRIRIGPMSSLESLDDVRSRLRTADIEYMLIRLKPQR